MTASPRILVAGIGNIFLGDDAFGVRVAQRLLRMTQPAGVQIIDFGIRGLDLAYALMDGFETTILIDAAPRGHAPGTLYLIEPEMPRQMGSKAPSAMLEGHSMNPDSVLRMVASMGGTVGRLLLVGCEPAPADPDQEMQMDLSPAVQAAVEPAARMVQSLVAKLLNDPSTTEVQYAHEDIKSPVWPDQSQP